MLEYLIDKDIQEMSQVPEDSMKRSLGAYLPFKYPGRICKVLSYSANATMEDLDAEFGFWYDRDYL
jgi:hypothetical protein